jgi:hypothetical protein
MCGSRAVPATAHDGIVLATHARDAAVFCAGVAVIAGHGQALTRVVGADALDAGVFYLALRVLEAAAIDGNIIAATPLGAAGVKGAGVLIVTDQRRMYARARGQLAAVYGARLLVQALVVRDTRVPAEWVGCVDTSPVVGITVVAGAVIAVITVCGLARACPRQRITGVMGTQQAVITFFGSVQTEA